MKVIGVIPARYGSTRFPGKPLALLAGRPLVLHVVDRAREASGLDEFLVATDDDRIAEVVREAGAEVVMTSAQCATGSDRIAEAIAGRDCDIVVNLQGDEPDVNPAVIDQCIQALADDPECGVATAMIAIRDKADFESPHIVKVVCDTSGRALFFSRAQIPSPARLTGSQTAEPGFIWGMKHLGLYAYRTDVLRRFVAWPQTPIEKRESLEQMRLLENGIVIRVVETQWDSVGVDTPEELERLNASLAERRQA